MANPSIPPQANFPIPPPVGQFKAVNSDGYPTVAFLEFLQLLWVAIQGKGGLLDLSELGILAEQISSDEGVTIEAVLLSLGIEPPKPQSLETFLFTTFQPLPLNNFRVCGGTPGRKPDAGEVLFSIPMKGGDWIPNGLSGSELKVDVNTGGVAPASNWTITLKKNATTIFTGTILAGQTSGTFSADQSVSFTEGDFLSGTAISPQDSTAASVNYTILGTRTQ